MDKKVQWSGNSVLKFTFGKSSPLGGKSRPSQAQILLPNKLGFYSGVFQLFVLTCHKS